MIPKISILIIVLVLLCLPVFAQESNRPLGWDLTYSSVLEGNKIAPKEWIRQWLATEYQSPAKKWISAHKGEPIISSVLIEYPAFHAGEHTTMWLFRTKNRAYYWQSVEDEESNDLKKDLKLQVYDNLFALASSWQQAKPLKAESTPTGGIPGYIGFLSFYDKGKSRQMLLSQEDFVICNTKECKTWKPGRVMIALKPVILR